MFEIKYEIHIGNMMISRSKDGDLILDPRYYNVFTFEETAEIIKMIGSTELVTLIEHKTINKTDRRTMSARETDLTFKEGK